MNVEIIYLVTLAVLKGSCASDSRQRIVFCNVLDRNIMENFPVIGNNCTHVAIHTGCLEKTNKDPGSGIFRDLTKLKELKERSELNGSNISIYWSCPLPVDSDSDTSDFVENVLFETLDEFNLDGFQITVEGEFSPKLFNAVQKFADHFANKTQYQFLIHLYEFQAAANSTVVQAFENVTKFFIINKQFINFINENETLQSYTQAWINAGIPRHKIIIDFISHGIQWTIPIGAPMPSTYDILNSKGVSVVSIIWNVVEYIEDNVYRHLAWDNLHRRHFMTFKNGTYASFETTTSMAITLNWIIDQHFAGAALTFLDRDSTHSLSDPFVLLEQIYNQIRHSQMITISEEGPYYYGYLLYSPIKTL